MSTTQKFNAGSPFPSLTKTDLHGSSRDLSKPSGDHKWQMLIVYRGRHCPLCTKYLNAMSTFTNRLNAIGIDLVAVSGDSAEQLEEHTSRLDVNFPLFHSLNIDEMKSLGLYISYPRSEQETDHPFPEPGLFIINEEGALQVVDISNNPFCRPDLESLVSGLEWVRSNDYPIRGTYPY